MNQSTDLLKELLYFETQIRLYHWKTKVYSRHVASGNLYKKMDDFLDKFVEVYQGKFNGGHMKGVPFPYDSFNIVFYNVDDNENDETDSCIKFGLTAI